MLPAFSVHNSTDRRIADPKHATDVSLGKPFLSIDSANHQNVAAGEAGICILLAKASPSLPTLAYLVGHVISRRAKEQMRRVDTARVVAGVAHEHAIRNDAVTQLPRHPMRSLATERAIAPTRIPEPLPAGIRATRPVCVVPEVSPRIGRLRHTKADARTEAGMPALLPGEQRTTTFTGKLERHSGLLTGSRAGGRAAIPTPVLYPTEANYG